MLVKFGLYSEIEGYDKIVNADDLGEILLKNLEIYLNGIFEYSGSCQILNNTYKYIYECMKMIRVSMGVRKIRWECIRMHDNEWSYIIIHNNA